MSTETFWQDTKQIAEAQTRLDTLKELLIAALEKLIKLNVECSKARVASAELKEEVWKSEEEVRLLRQRRLSKACKPRQGDER